MKIVIIEDEEYASERLSELICEIDSNHQVLAILTSVNESIQWFTDHSNYLPDLVLSDIQLTDGLSFSIFENINTFLPVIFTTAYDEYAIEAFKHNGISYLLKPIVRRELQSSLEKHELLKGKSTFDIEKIKSIFPVASKEYKKRFMIQAAGRIKTIEADSIMCFQSEGKMVYMNTFENTSLPSDMTLESLSQSLDPAQFFRINRKYIINFKAIKSMYQMSRGRVKIELCYGQFEDMIVSVERSSEFKKWLDK